VFVDRGNGFFEPREVETGARFDDRVVIAKGLKEGERVVVAGTFLVDSESRLKTVAAGMSDSKPEAPMSSPGMENAPRKTAEVKQAKMAEMKHTEMAGMNHSSAMQGMEEAKTATGETVDHKCGMKIDRAKSVAEGNTLEYQGTTYYFCSKSCKDGFAKHPEQYVSSGHQTGGQ